MMTVSQWRSHPGLVYGVLVSAIVLLVPCGVAVAYDEDPESREDVTRLIEMLDPHTRAFRIHYDEILTEQEVWEPQKPRPELWTELLAFEEALSRFYDASDEPSDAAPSERTQLSELAHPARQLFARGKTIHQLVEQGNHGETLVEHWGQIYTLLRTFALELYWPETAGWDAMPEWEVAHPPRSAPDPALP